MSVLLRFYKENDYTSGIDGGKISRAGYKVSLDDTTIVLTSKILLHNRKLTDLIMCLDTTCKVMFNGFLVHIIGCIDKQ